MRIIKRGIIPNYVKFRCKLCGCEFSEKAKKCKPFRWSDGRLEYSHSCPECNSYVQTVLKDGKCIAEE